MTSAEHLAKYACDECHDRKIRCSREASGCTQCQEDSRNCVYSRSGVIRRRARQSKRKFDATEQNGQHEAPKTSEPTASTTTDLRPQLDKDIDLVQDSLNQYSDSENDASSTLATLGTEYSSFWQGPDLKEMAKELGVDEKKFLPFPDGQESLFMETFVKVSRKGRPIFTPIPPAILHDIRCNPEAVNEKAYMVIVYGILLTEACLDGSYDKTTISKLRWNLRLAMDDAKLLLEPSDINIQALILLACHVQEVSTPSFCWMMISTACRMLQTLGVNSRSLDPETRDRRLMLFWMLNGLDKSLALISGRSPTFVRAMFSKVPTIELQKMLVYQPHMSGEERGEGFKSMFGAHIMRQMHLLSVVLSDIWVCLFENGSEFDQVRKKLDEWWQQSSSVLEACLLSEKPFVDDNARISMELGIKNQEFHYNYLTVLLIRSKPTLREECVSASQRALFLLNDLVSDSNEVYNGIVWALLYCPFTPFFVLFGHVLSTRKISSNERSLEAMEKLSTFLARMRPRHPRAAKLQTIAAALVKYARAVLTKSAGKASKANGQPKRLKITSESGPRYASSTPASDANDTTLLQSSEDVTPPVAYAQQPIQNVFDDPSLQALSMDLDFWLPNSQSWEASGMQMDGAGAFSDNGGPGNDPYGFFTDSTFDWFSWDANLSDPLGFTRSWTG